MLKKYGIYIILVIAILLLCCILAFSYKYSQDVKVAQQQVEETLQRAQQNNKEATNAVMQIQPPKKEKKPKSITATVPIFMYHFVAEDPGQNPYPENVVKTSTLEEQLKYLKENNYDTIFITDLENLHQYEKPVALTFDDGFLDVYQNAFPLLKKYNIKASMYIVNDFTTKPGYCTIEQLQEMLDSGFVAMESHTVTHNRLATLSAQRVQTELTDSKAFLKEKLDVDSTVLCYPYGSFNNMVTRIAKEQYKYGLAMDGGVYIINKHTDPYQIARIYANRSMPINTFKNYCTQASVNVVWEEE